MKKIWRNIPKETKRNMLLVLLGTLLLSFLLFFLDFQTSMPTNQDGQSILERNGYGEGSKQETVLATVQMKDREQEEKMQVEVGEQTYSLEEMEAVFDDAARKLEETILGENKNLDAIHSDLNLVSKIPDTAITVTWELSNYTIMNLQGEIQEAELTDGGVIEELTAVLSYEDQQAVHLFVAKVFPPIRSANEEVRNALEERVKEAEESTREEPEIILPDEVDGKQISWQKERKSRGVYVLMLGAIICGLLLALDRQKEMESQKLRQKQMILDYPELVSKLTLLLGAGMTVKNAWIKMVADYESRKKGKKTRYAYEEMIISYHEMLGGVTEGECYERFGRRCNTREYRKLGAMLSQNLRKGSQGLTPLLKMEAGNAMEERKAHAKRLGEEASTKLLGPMFGMLAIVLIIVIVPAFFSMQF